MAFIKDKREDEDRRSYNFQEEYALLIRNSMKNFAVKIFHLCT